MILSTAFAWMFTLGCAELFSPPAEEEDDGSSDDGSNDDNDNDDNDDDDDDDDEPADDDGDGWTNEDELDEGTDPDAYWSRPYDRCRDDIKKTGDEVGDVIKDFEAEDQNGDVFRLYDYCEHTVLLVNAGYT